VDECKTLPTARPTSPSTGQHARPPALRRVPAPRSRGIENKHSTAQPKMEARLTIGVNALTGLGHRVNIGRVLVLNTPPAPVFSHTRSTLPSPRYSSLQAVGAQVEIESNF